MGYMTKDFARLQKRKFTVYLKENDDPKPNRFKIENIFYDSRKKSKKKESK